MIGLPFDHVTTSFFDLEGNWWFADSQFKRTGELSKFKSNIFIRKQVPFIVKWKELDNKWKYYYPNESNVIQNMDVNTILRVGGIVYFGTMSGLLYLDLFNNDWSMISVQNGLNDAAIWDLMWHGNSIFLATINGINEISIINHSVIPDQDKRFDFLRNIEIYDMLSDSMFFYFTTALGLYKMNWQDEKPNLISQRKFKQIKLYEDSIIGTDGSLWIVDEGKEDQYITSNINHFDICGSYVWMNKNNKAIVLDLISNWEWEYDKSDGIPGNDIHGIECDEDWVWFLTNQGIAFYNWGDYHQKD